MQFYFANFSFEIEIVIKKQGCSDFLVNVIHCDGGVLVKFSL